MQKGGSSLGNRGALSVNSRDVSKCSYPKLFKPKVFIPVHINYQGVNYLVDHLN